MNLKDLHANYEHGCLWLDCPCGKGHRIHMFTDECMMPTPEKKFAVVGKFPKITIHPALLSECASFSIIEGEIRGLVS